MVFALSQKTLKEIADQFGLKNCRDIKIHIPITGIVTITAEVYPEVDGIRSLMSVLKVYELTERATYIQEQ